jgi:hypothetical protein
MLRWNEYVSINFAVSCIEAPDCRIGTSLFSHHPFASTQRNESIGIFKTFRKDDTASPRQRFSVTIGRCVKAGITWAKTVIVLPVINEDEVVLIITRRSPT